MSGREWKERERKWYLFGSTTSTKKRNIPRWSHPSPALISSPSSLLYAAAAAAMAIITGQGNDKEWEQFLGGWIRSVFESSLKHWSSCLRFQHFLCSSSPFFCTSTSVKITILFGICNRYALPLPHKQIFIICCLLLNLYLTFFPSGFKGCLSASSYDTSAFHSSIKAPILF